MPKVVEHGLGFLINDGRNFFLIDSLEMNEKIYRGMGEFAEFLYKLKRIPQKIDPASVFYTKLLEEVDPTLVKWKSAVAFR
jgi:hypothetical protein